MINKISAFVLGLAASSCTMASCGNGLGNLTMYSFFALGPNALYSANNNPDVWTSLNTGKDAWDSTDAVDRAEIYFGTAGNDCPYNQTREVGAFSFSGTNCVTTNSLDPTITLAFMDSGTRSISINLDFPWAASNTPSSTQYHLASVLVHEFGHVLGFGHMGGGVCSATATSSCSTSGAETMSATIGAGETCRATIEANDISNANAIY